MHNRSCLNCTTCLPVPHIHRGPEDSLSFWGSPGLTNTAGEQQSAAAAAYRGAVSDPALQEQQLLILLALTDGEKEIFVIHLSGSGEH